MVFDKEKRKLWVEANKQRLILYRASRKNEVKLYNNLWYNENLMERREQMKNYNNVKLHRRVY